MNGQLEGKRQAIDYLSIHLEMQGVKHKKIEACLKQQGKKYEKLDNAIEMHYNIILIFYHGSQFVVGHPIVSTNSVRDKPIQEETMQQTNVALNN